MNKKLSKIALGLILATSMAIPTCAEAPIEYSVSTINARTRSTYDVGEPVWEDSVTSRAATISVSVTSPCDQRYRSQYSDYEYAANKVVERADDYIYKKFGIDFTSVAQPIWTSSGGNPTEMVEDARIKFGLTYNGNKTADLMMAFCGTLFQNSSGQLTLGMGAIGKPYACVFNDGYSQNAKTCQHEAGHTYGLYDHTGSGTCVMKQGGPDDIDTLCTSHETQWRSSKNKY